MVENVARTQRIQLTIIEHYENRQICTFKEQLMIEYINDQITHN